MNIGKKFSKYFYTRLYIKDKIEKKRKKNFVPVQLPFEYCAWNEQLPSI